jgi:hypothetical protein
MLKLYKTDSEADQIGGRRPVAFEFFVELREIHPGNYSVCCACCCHVYEPFFVKSFHFICSMILNRADYETTCTNWSASKSICKGRGAHTDSSPLCCSWT